MHYPPEVRNLSSYFILVHLCFFYILDLIIMYVQFYLLKKIGAIKGNGELMHEPHGKLCLEENKLNILDNISVL